MIKEHSLYIPRCIGCPFKVPNSCIITTSILYVVIYHFREEIKVYGINYLALSQLNPFAHYPRLLALILSYLTVSALISLESISAFASASHSKKMRPQVLAWTALSGLHENTKARISQAGSQRSHPWDSYFSSAITVSRRQVDTATQASSVARHTGQQKIPGNARVVSVMVMCDIDSISTERNMSGRSFKVSSSFSSTISLLSQPPILAWFHIPQLARHHHHHQLELGARSFSLCNPFRISWPQTHLSKAFPVLRQEYKRRPKAPCQDSNIP